MLFNSIQFALFLPIVFLLYWWVFDYCINKSKRQLVLQNAFIVVASYVFYGWWDWRFLLLIAFTSLCSWGSGLLIGKATTKKRAKTWMWLNTIVNLGILALFKYYDFFVAELAQLFHVSSEGLLLKVILPVGISFYTFQALSYSIDIYRGKITPTKVVFVYAPLHNLLKDNLEETQTRRAYQDLSRRYDISLLDFSTMEISSDINYFMNGHHVNQKGAEIFTTALAYSIDSLNILNL